MFFVDVETAEGAATCAALMAREHKPSQVSRMLKNGKTSTLVGFPDAASKAAEEAKDTPEYAGAAYAYHIIAEAQKLTPHILKELPNGNTLLISADLPQEQIRTLFQKALRA